MPGRSPAVILYDSSGNEVGVVLDGAVYLLQTEAKLKSASKGTSTGAGLTSNPIDANTEALHVDGSNVTQPISAASLPLPTGAATEATLASIKDTDGVKKITDALPAGTNLLGKVQLRNPGDTVDLGDASNPVRIDPTGSTTQPISAASLPLPTGAATEATLATRATAAAQTDGSQKAQVLSSAKGTSVSAGITSNPIDANTEALHVDGSNVTQPISAASLPLPTGAATEATLASIKDTDGVKKITDPLPAGTNEIGYVAQGTKAAAADAWPQVLYDASGNPVGVVLDGAIYRLRTEAKLVGGSTHTELAVANSTTLPANTRGLIAAGLDGTTTRFAKVDASGQPVIVGSGVAGAPSGGVLTIQGSIGGTAVPVSQAAASATNLVVQDVLNAGSADLRVNGSGTAVDFTLAADPTYDILLSSLRFTMVVSTAVIFDGASFAASGVLTNGILVQLTVNGGTTVTLATLTLNEDLLKFANAQTPIMSFDGSADVLSSQFALGERVRLVAGSGDQVLVRIRDNLTGLVYRMDYFRATVYGVQE